MQGILSKKILQSVKVTGNNFLPSPLQVRLQSTKFN
jgi:hypothetical protein